MCSAVLLRSASNNELIDQGSSTALLAGSLNDYIKYSRNGGERN